MNTITIMGHLSRDKEEKILPNGTKITTLNVASNVYQKGGNETMWWRVTLWGDQFDRILNYLSKGKPVIVTGQMQPARTYTDSQGETRVSLEMRGEIVQFSPFGRNSEAEASQGGMSGIETETGTNSGFGGTSSGFGQTEAAFAAPTSGGFPAGADIADDSTPF